MASWSVAPGAQKISHKGHLTPPAGGDLVQEQYKVAADAAQAIINSRAIGVGATFTVALSGVTNVGHPNGDSITVTVTNAN